MFIQTLIEDTKNETLHPDLTSEHGLSFYIETKNHKILVDAGKSDAFMKNATKLGIDLSKIDTVILSHGHYDHGGGLIPFLNAYPNVHVYLRAKAFGKYYSNRNNSYHKIGIDPQLINMEQVHIVHDLFYKIDDTITLFSGVSGTKLLSDISHQLLELNSNITDTTNPNASYFHADSFQHEQYLVVHEDKQSVLFTSCSHCGIVNILDTYHTYFPTDPSFIIGGFHLMDPATGKSIDQTIVENIGQELLKLDSVCYTGHCTGMEAYHTLKKIMGTKINYCHTGDVISH